VYLEVLAHVRILGWVWDGRPRGLRCRGHTNYGNPACSY
jgi:hypothetical protein